MSTDLFSKQSTLYSQYRPRYPDQLYEFILNNCPGRNLAWDCGTGNGQAAVHLSRYFKSVIATDISEVQIRNAIKAENVDYMVLKAEEPAAAEPSTVDLITVAQALHWFDLDKFYQEARRVLRPNGIFATWGYAFHSPIDKSIDPFLERFYFDILGPFWKPNNKLLWDNYEKLEFPFREIATPKIDLEVIWSLDDLLKYFKTWSSTQIYTDKTKTDPTVELFANLLPHWGEASARKMLKWRLAFRVGKL